MPTPPLTPEHRQAILDATPGCRGYKEIATKMGVPVNTLKSRIDRLGISDQVKEMMYPGIIRASPSTTFVKENYWIESGSYHFDIDGTIVSIPELNWA